MASVEYVLLANHVEVQNGLLYVSGGGWANLYRGQVDPEGPPPINYFGVGASVLIPWDETNQIHHLTIRIEREDDQELVRAETDIEVGRPPGLPQGAHQRVAVGFGINVPFPSEGSYRAVATMDEDARSVDFQVFDQPKPQYLP